MQMYWTSEHVYVEAGMILNTLLKKIFVYNCELACLIASVGELVL